MVDEQFASVCLPRSEYLPAEWGSLRSNLSMARYLSTVPLVNDFVRSSQGARRGGSNVNIVLRLKERCQEPYFGAPVFGIQPDGVSSGNISSKTASIGLTWERNCSIDVR